MNELRFDGQVAIVTGAGSNPGLGRAYAHLLAKRGASVLVNDIGLDEHGTPLAEIVAAELRAMGASALANLSSVANVDSAGSIVAAAVESFGRVDILVNNAGIPCHVAIDETDPQDFRKTIDVNLLGQAWLCQAVWPVMRRQHYGRIVNIASAALTGFTLHAAYGASKGGVFSLGRSLAAEGEPLGIKVNIVNPGAFTSLVAATFLESSPIYRDAKAGMPADLVAPVVAFLAHPSCPVTGECISAVGGKVKRLYLSETPGFEDKALTIESVASRWAEVMAMEAASIVGVGSIPSDSWQVRA